MSHHYKLHEAGLEVAHPSPSTQPEVVERWFHGRRGANKAWAGSRLSQQHLQPSRIATWLPILSTATIVVLVIAVAVTGGVLGSKVSRLERDIGQYQLLSSSAAMTDYPQTVIQDHSVLGRNDCPNVDGHNLTVATYQFVRRCDLTYPAWASALAGGSILDYSVILAGSMEECISHCVRYNSLMKGATGRTCRAVEYAFNITRTLTSVLPKMANCWIKSDQSAHDMSSPGSQVAYLVSGTAT